MNELLKALKEKLGADTITEELETKLKADFDSAVEESVKTKVEEKEAELEEQAEGELGEFKQGLIDKLDEFINESVEEFTEENKVVIESQCKVEAAEKLFEGITSTLKTQGIDIPEESRDLVSELEEKISKREDELNKALEEKSEFKAQIFEHEKALKFKELTSDLSESDSERVLDLIEGIDVDTIEDFEKKVGIVMEKVNKREEKSGVTDDSSNVDHDDLNEEHEVDQYAPKFF